MFENCRLFLIINIHITLRSYLCFFCNSAFSSSKGVCLVRTLSKGPKEGRGSLCSNNSCDRSPSQLHLSLHGRARLPDVRSDIGLQHHAVCLLYPKFWETQPDLCVFKDFYMSSKILYHILQDFFPFLEKKLPETHQLVLVRFVFYNHLNFVDDELIYFDTCQMNYN